MSTTTIFTIQDWRDQYASVGMGTGDAEMSADDVRAEVAEIVRSISLAPWDFGYADDAEISIDPDFDCDAAAAEFTAAWRERYGESQS